MSPSPTTARRAWRGSDVDADAPAPRSSDKDLQRAVGSCRIVVKGTEYGNQIVDVFQCSPRIFLVWLHLPDVIGKRIGTALDT